MKSKNKKIFIATGFLAFLLFPSISHAGVILDSIGDAIFGQIIGLVLNILGNLLAFIMYLFDWLLIISVGFYDAPVVDAGWRITRDFANMFFIVALIIMAFATIFEVSKWDFRSMIGRFLLSAVLINFTFSLFRLFLLFSDVISHVFLTAIGDASGQLGQGLGVASIVSTNDGLVGSLASIGGGLLSTITTGIFSIILIGGLVMSMGTAAAFLFVRIPILWIILVLAPIAILLNMFPNGKGNFDKWLNYLIGWGLFLPIYLFFMYFGMYFLSQQGEAVASIAKNVEIPGGVPFQVAFSYFLVWFFMMGGLKVAMNFSFIASAGVVTASKKPGQWIAQRSGLAGAWQARKKQWTEEGVYVGGRKVWGGEQDRQRREAWIAGKMGVRGQDLKYQQAFVDQAGKDFNDFDTRYRLGQMQIDGAGGLREIANSGSATNPRVYAARKVLAKIGQLDDSIANRTSRELANNAFALEDFAKAATSGKWSALRAGSVRAQARGDASYTDPATGTVYDYSHLRTPSGTGYRREAVKKLQADKEVLSSATGATPFTRAEFEEYVTLLGGPTTYEGREFVKAVGELRPDIIYDTWFTNGGAGGPFASLNTKSLSRADLFRNTLNKANNEQLAFMPVTLWGDGTGAIPTDPDFNTALFERFEKRNSGWTPGTTLNRDQQIFRANILDEIGKTPDAAAKTTAARALMT